jgi:hypothetical protein
LVSANCRVRHVSNAADADRVRAARPVQNCRQRQ